MKKSLKSIVVAIALLVSLAAFSYTNIDARSISSVKVIEHLPEEPMKARTLLPELKFINSVISLIKKNSPKL